MSTQPSDPRVASDVAAEQAALQQAQAADAIGGKTVEELRKVAKERGIAGSSSMNRAELLGALADTDQQAEAAEEASEE